MASKYTIGLDYGTNSVRAVLVNVADGREAATNVWNYAAGKNGIITDPKDPNLARQHPKDYLTGITKTIKGVLVEAQVRLR